MGKNYEKLAEYLQHENDVLRHQLREKESSAEPCCSNATPWPVNDILKKLIEATDILLDDKNYTGDCWEQLHAARTEARKLVKH